MAGDSAEQMSNAIFSIILQCSQAGQISECIRVHCSIRQLVLGKISAIKSKHISAGNQRLVKQQLSTH